ncbi:Protein MODIFIER OF SNC1 1 [Morella rubra]|uniref:Protein MODIFIER OF SNC1 1 n=1 Tax=Morella rubra TaxID=262757 RepID=A0A6A1UL70_9ROSI|nr:Protein MODIFIER OF SNC1 1 [Morella rubra]
MTVLGKVAVPKPINLPSQRLENHGLDPSVEIVPKGTHSWGSRSSSSTSNAWGSSALSPRTDGGSGSPSHLSGRPSSGGSGTRPSTAGSDRAHEPNANAWGPNSRPSSASGALTSNQTSLTSLRPRSAETRPGSSQLSRFAEPLSENPGAWGAAGTPEKLGVAPKNDEFSLASGDFPTLGSEKDSSGKNIESQALPHLESSHASGDVSSSANVRSSTSNSWRRENPPYSEDAVTSSMEHWQADPQPYPNPSIPAHHFEAWHGPPVTSPPTGVWFRGPPGGPPYGPPVAPGGFPMEPFPYYHPQVPATALTNPQPGPPPGGGPRGHHPKNGDLYRPHMSDAYIRPGMPIRPGFYPGPVAYEGYYGRPVSYCGSNERDISFMGMAAGPSVYNRYSPQNAPEPNNPQGRSGGYSSSGKTLASEHGESGHPHDTRGPYRVLLKQQNGWDGKNEEKKWEGETSTNATHVEKGDQPGVSSWETDWRSDYRNDEDMGFRRMAPGQEVSSQTYDERQSSYSVPAKVKSPERVENVKVFDDVSARNSEHASSGLPEVPGSVSAVLKDYSLIQKIEGLNAKARASDGQHDIKSVSSWEEHNNKSQVHNAKANHSADEGGSGSVYSERTHATGITNPASREMGVSAGDKSLESTAASGTISRRSFHGVQGRAGNRGKGGPSSHEVDGWRKRYPGIDSSSVVSASNIESNSSVHVHERHTSVEAPEKSVPHPQARDEKESAPPVVDPNDNQAQRPKLRELEQRAKQLREEEEERTRKQMAKALAKLEELDRRKQSMEVSTQKSENAPKDAFQNKQELNVIPQIIEGSTSRIESPVCSSEPPPEKPKTGNKELILHKQSVSLRQDADSADVIHRNNAPHGQDGSALKQKRMGYKQKQNLPLEKSSNERSISTSTDEAPKSHTGGVGKVAVSVGEFALNRSITTSTDEAPKSHPGGAGKVAVSVGEFALNCESSLLVNSNAVAESSSLPVNANALAESSVHQRKKNNRSGKNKHKVETAISVATLPSSDLKETTLVNVSPESDKPKATETELDPNLVQSVTSSKDEKQLSEHCSSLLNEDSHGRVNTQWKSHHSRRMPRNTQVNRPAEKFHSDAIWAPVRSQNKADTDEANNKNGVEAITPSMKSDQQVQSNLKNKRAEIERYVPKPAAKEMAQQGSIQQPVASSITQTTSDEIVGRTDSCSQGTESTQSAGSTVGKVELALESRGGDGRQNKQGKAHGSWRQRGSAESVNVQSVRDGPSSHTGRKVQKAIQDYQSQKPDVGSVKEQQEYGDEWNAPDGWNIPNNSDSAAIVVKDQGVTGRAKRHTFKGQKGLGNSNDFDQKKTSGNTSKIDSQSSSLEVSQTDLPVSLKENRGIGERSTAHWQPKSQTVPASYQQGSRTSTGRSVGAGVAWTNKKDSTHQGAVPLAPLDKGTGEGVLQPQHDQSPSESIDAEETLDERHQEAKRGRKVGSVRGRPHSPNQIPVSPVEQSSGSMDVRHEQRSSSGFRKSGNHNNTRLGRGHESRGDWNSFGQESRHNYPPGNWERQRHNSHYEYHPVGPYSNNKSNTADGPKDGTLNTGARFRQRGQNHSRRGGGSLCGRESGNDQVDAGFEWE